MPFYSCLSLPDSLAAHRRQWLSRLSNNTAFACCSACGLFMTTKSSPCNAGCCCRNDSRMMRLSRLRSVASRQCFFDTAKPNRARPSLFALQSTVNCLSRLRVAVLNTRPKAAASRSRLPRVNRNDDVAANRRVSHAVSTVAYGVSLARPLARRRLSTSRPALVAIRARKPWVRARLILLGWYVRFMNLDPA